MEESLRHPENPILETKEYLRRSLTDHAGTGHNSSVEPRRWVWRTWDHNSQHLQILSYSVGLQITQVLPYKQTVSGRLGDLLSLLLFLMDT